MVEQLCESCFAERLHDERSGMLVCRTCGTVTAVTNSNGNAATNGVGVSGEGARQRSVTTNAYAVTAYAEMLHGDDLAALDRDPEFARFICETAGLEFRQDEPGEVVLGETPVIVRIWVDDHGYYVIRPVSEERVPTFPGTSIQALKLGQFYASVCADRVLCPTGPELARWKRRALIDWGAIRAPLVHLCPLPQDAPGYVAAVWEGIGLLLAVRRMTEPDETGFPLTRSFVHGWCGCELQVAKRALGWLDRNGYIWRTGSVSVGKYKPMTLWAVAESGVESCR